MPRTSMNAGVNERRRLLGSLAFVLGIQYFVVQLVVGLRYTPSYSLANNAISDLGNTACGPFHSQVVCSPLHGVMNGSFVVLGLCMMAGAFLPRDDYRRSRGTMVGLGLFGLGGVGAVLVGLFPENTVPALHALGAALPFFFGNVGLVILGTSMGEGQPFRAATFLAGAISLIGLGFIFSGHYAGLGAGGMERVVAYPQTIWMIAIGLYGCLHPRTPLMQGG